MFKAFFSNPTKLFYVIIFGLITILGVSMAATSFAGNSLKGSQIEEATIRENEVPVVMSSSENETTQEKIAIEEYVNLGISNVDSYLNVRETPDSNGKVVGKLPQNAGCEIIETLDGWYNIKSGDASGYVSAEYILTDDEAYNRAVNALKTVAVVTAGELRVRTQPDLNSEVITTVAQNEELDIVQTLDGWISVYVSGETIGYVSADYVTIKDVLPKGVKIVEVTYVPQEQSTTVATAPATTVTAPVSAASSATAASVVQYAMQFLGCPYVYGGNSLTSGTDCSGFTKLIYQNFGYNINRTARTQMSNGTPVSLSAVSPGDLIFYGTGHVALYIGNGQIIHAATSAKGIIVASMYCMTPTAAVRIIN